MSISVDVRDALRTALDDEQLSDEAVLMFGALLQTSGFPAGWGFARADWTDSDLAVLAELQRADYITRSPKDGVAAFLATRFFVFTEGDT